MRKDETIINYTANEWLTPKGYNIVTKVGVTVKVGDTVTVEDTVYIANPDVIELLDVRNRGCRSRCELLRDGLMGNASPCLSRKCWQDEPYVPLIWLRKKDENQAD